MTVSTKSVLRADRPTRVLLGAAALWSVGLVVAALTAPAYSSTSASSSSPSSPSGASGHPTTTPTMHVMHTSATLVQVNGLGSRVGFAVLAPVSLPLLAVVVVAFALWRRRKSETPGAGSLAWLVTVLLLGVALLGMLSIGLFIGPVAVILAVACARSSGVPARHLQPPRTGLE
ncbi:MAG: hypothetical protein ACYDH5_19690 [Acidimicrobiales bacterium]